MTKKNPKKVLIVDDETEILELMTLTLEEAGFKVIAAKDGVDATFKLRNETFDILITDLHMPKKSGSQLVSDVLEDSDLQDLPILVISGDLSAFKTKFSMNKQVNLLEKPFDLDVFLDKVKVILDPNRAGAEISDKFKRQVKKSELLINAGDDAKEMYWVISGKFTAYKIENEKEVVLGTINNGELIGEMSFLDSQERSVYVRALEESEVLIIPPSKFTKVLEAQPKWFKNLVRNLSLRLRETNKKVHSA